MFCKNCGSEIDDESKFCSKCGAPAENSNSMPAQSGTISNKNALEKRKKKSKGCLTAVLIFFAFIVFASVIGSHYSSKTEPKATKDLSQEELKAQGLEFDDQAWSDYLSLYGAHNKFMSAIKAYSDNQMSKLDFYNYCKKVKEYFAKASLSFGYGKTDDEKTYLSTFETFAIEDQMAAEKIMKYLDSNATKDLSAANENIERAKQAAATIAGNRTVLLKKIGLAEEEINKKINQGLADIEALDKK